MTYNKSEFNKLMNQQKNMARKSNKFKVDEVAEKLKLQLKKLELIRLLSDQMLKKKRLGRDIFMRGIKGKIKSIYSENYSVNLYDLLKSYSTIYMQKDFQKINIPKLPVFTTEDGINRIKRFLNNLNDWKNINALYPENFMKSKDHNFNKDIGCTKKELVGHLESLFKPGMNWENYGSGEDGDHKGSWHIDHIIQETPFKFYYQEVQIHSLKN